MRLLTGAKKKSFVNAGGGASVTFDTVGEGVTCAFAELEPGVLEGGGGENGDKSGVIVVCDG